MARIRHPDEGKPIEKRRPVKKPDADAAPGFLRFLRMLECCVTGASNGFLINRGLCLDAHHPTVGRNCMGRKAPDRWAVPVARDYHLDSYPEGLHRGERAFWNRHGIDPEAVAFDLWRVWQTSQSVSVGKSIIFQHRELATIRRAHGVLIYP